MLSTNAPLSILDTVVSNARSIRRNVGLCLNTFVLYTWTVRKYGKCEEGTNVN